MVKIYIKNILKNIETPYVDAQTLLNLLNSYRKPREFILRLVKNKELIRLKNGFYLIRDNIDEKALPYEMIANLLYGPSYVSLEWALSFYSMIPERVFSITNMTLGKNKEFHTEIGPFIYYKLSEESYPIGITLKSYPNSIGKFLIATPEKALVDLVYKKCVGMNKKQLKIELLESKRIDIEHLNKLDKNLISEIANFYKSKSVKNLINLIGEL